MPRNSRKLRLLILATLASSGASTSLTVHAGPTAWSCHTDPLTGGWACAQSGDKLRAETAVRMSQRAAGNPEPTPEQLEIATSSPGSVTPAEMTPETTPLAESMAKARIDAEQRATAIEDELAAVTDTATPPARPVAEAPTMREPEPEPETIESAPAPAQPQVPPQAPTGILQSNVITFGGQSDAASSPPSRPEPTPPDEPRAMRTERIESRPPAPITEPAPEADSAPVTSTDDAATPDTGKAASAEPLTAEPAPRASAAIATDQRSADAPRPVTEPGAQTTPPERARHEFPRRVGNVSESDLADLAAARASLDRGVTDNDANAGAREDLARLQALNAATNPDAAPDTVPDEWPEAAFEDGWTLAPTHADSSDAATYPVIDERRAWALCGANDANAMTQGIPLRPSADRDAEALRIAADDVQGKRQQYYTLYGDARIERGDQSLAGEIIHYDATTERADAEGDVRYREAGLSMRSDWGYLVMANDTGEFGPSGFYLPDRHARGTAEHIAVKSRTVWTGQDTRYTTCNYGVDSWYLESDEVELDRGEGVGTATNALVRFMGVPIAYAPWLTFPIDDRRKTGLLTPSYGRSDTDGTKLVMPFYWNIAPDQDATFTPYLLFKRGLRLDTEYRYLNPNGGGLVEVDILPDDDVYQKDRGLFHWEHAAGIADDLDLDIYATHVSDPFYFKDFDTELFGSETTSLIRRAQLTYTPGDWLITARMQEDYLVDRTTAKAARPYRRLPEITAATRHFDPATGLDFDFESRLTYFQNAARLEGARVEVTPTLRMPFRASYGHVTPELQVNYRQWNLSPANSAGAALGQTEVVPTIALDSELFIDKDITLGGESFIHTIEPRLRYTYTPEVNQATRPLFDTSLQELSYATLFENNRFAGGDRIGDANQLAVGVTSRLLSPEYGEYGHISFGELFYFEDRNVTLGPQTNADRAANSDFVTELFANLPFGITALANLRWDHKLDQTPSHNWDFTWSATPEQYLRYTYTHQQAVARASTFEFGWPLSPRWHMIGRYEYDHLRARNSSNLFGIEYENCCWAARFAAQTDYQTYTTSAASSANPAPLDNDTALMFQIELKGLTGFGNNLKSFFGSNAYF